MEKHYTQDFFAGQRSGSRRSAEAIVPYIVDVMRPRSVIDIGCGVGHWPATFKQSGTWTAHGVDGPWVRQSGLELDAGSFVEFDFSEAEIPFGLETPFPKYDLLTSFEFAEHIPEDKAEGLVELLCSLSNAIVFGAAVPGQGGVNHVNEQWPDYWTEKFARRGYVPCDFVRPAIWGLPDVEPWYAQNSIGYFRGTIPWAVRMAAESAWKAFAKSANGLAHPGVWDMRFSAMKQRLRQQRREIEELKEALARQDESL